MTQKFFGSLVSPVLKTLPLVSYPHKSDDVSVLKQKSLEPTMDQNCNEFDLWKKSLEPTMDQKVSGTHKSDDVRGRENTEKVT